MGHPRISLLLAVRLQTVTVVYSGKANFLPIFSAFQFKHFAFSINYMPFLILIFEMEYSYSVCSYSYVNAT